MMLIRITGSQLHAARVLVGLSREEVAERAGLCRHSIRKWETSSHAIPGAMYTHLCTHMFLKLKMGMWNSTRQRLKARITTAVRQELKSKRLAHQSIQIPSSNYRARGAMHWR